MLAKTPPASDRVLVKLRNADDWRGDELRFQLNSGDAAEHADHLARTYRHIESCVVVFSSDAPTHAYRNGRLEKLVDGTPPGYHEVMQAAPSDFRDRTALEAGAVAVAILALMSFMIWMVA